MYGIFFMRRHFMQRYFFLLAGVDTCPKEFERLGRWKLARYIIPMKFCIGRLVMCETENPDFSHPSLSSPSPTSSSYYVVRNE